MIELNSSEKKKDGNVTLETIGVEKKNRIHLTFECKEYSQKVKYAIRVIVTSKRKERISCTSEQLHSFQWFVGSHFRLDILQIRYY